MMNNHRGNRYSTLSVLLLSAILLLTLMPSVGLADYLDTWHWRNPIPQGHTLLSVAYGNNTFVAITDNGTILTSPNGATWTRRSSGTAKALNGVTYGGNLFVAVGSYGTILTSPDGITWTSQNSGVSDKMLYGVTYGGGTFVAVGTRETIISSTDGVTWTLQYSYPVYGQTLYGVAYGNDTFVAVGAHGTVYTSYDGVEWDSPSSVVSTVLKGVVYGNGIFVAVVSDGAIYTSTNGYGWTPADSGTTSALNGITYGNSTFVAVGSGGILLTSADGTTWTSSSSDTSSALNGVAYGNNTFVAVGEAGSILTSSDLVNWTSRTSGVIVPLNGAAYGNNTFVAVGDGGTVLTSSDGRSWTKRNSGVTAVLNGVCYENGIFVTVGDAGVILTSSNGIAWTRADTGGVNWITLYAVAYGNNTFVAVGTDGTSFTSSNGSVWFDHETVDGDGFTSLAFGSGTFVAVTESGSILTSSNGATWSHKYTGVGDPLYAIAYGTTNGTGTFVAVGTNGSVFTSSTPTVPSGWIERDSGSTGVLNAITYGNSTFVAVGNSGSILSSPDGKVWTLRDPGVAESFYGIAYGMSSDFVAVGYNGAIIQTSSGPEPAQCGSADGGTFTAAPTTGLCSEGTPSAVTGNGPWNWTCQGTAGGAAANCSAHIKPWSVTPSVGPNGNISPNTLQTINNGATATFTVTPDAGYSGTMSGTCGGSPSSGTAPFTYTTNPITGDCTVITTFSLPVINGVCGSANGGTFTTAPTTGLCSAGTPSTVTGSGPWIWTCQGLNGGATPNCSTLTGPWTVTPSAGPHVTISPNTLQTVNNGATATFTVTPEAGYGATMSGTCSGSPPSGTGVFTYTTNPVVGNCTVIASTGDPINGVCGPANGGTFTAAPTTGLCNAGTPSTVTGSGPWNWACQGLNGGTDMTCEAIKAPWTVTPSAGPNGAISPNTPQFVIDNTTKSFTVTPAAGYSVTMSGTCGGSPSSGTIPFTYTTNPVTGSCTVIAGFTEIPVNLANWALRTSGVTVPLNGIAYGPVNGASTFVAVGNAGTLLTSSDGTSWTKRTSGVTVNLNNVFYGNGIFVTVGDEGAILTSSNGIDWTQGDTGGADWVSLYGVAFGNNTFVAVGTDGYSFTSLDGTVWSLQEGFANTYGDGLNDVTFGSGSFVAVTANGAIITSPDGVIWTHQFAGAGDPLYAIAYGPVNGTGTFVAVGTNGEVFTSSTPTVPNAWTNSSSGTTSLLNSIAYGNNTFLTVGNGGAILSSPDAITWTLRDAGVAESFYAATYGNFSFVAVGNKGVILQTVPADSSIINGVCGSANAGTCSAPTTNLCSQGAPSAVTGTGPWTWSCEGSNGGITTNCQANIQFWTVTPSAGSNVTISPDTPQNPCNGATASFTVTPDANYNAVVTGSCGGTLTGTTYTTNPIAANCTVVATSGGYNGGVCGSAGGSTRTSAPTSNLCSQGTPSPVMGDGPWTWICQGSNGGTNVNCQANIANAPIWTITASVTGGNGTISCMSPVNEESDSTCAITPKVGYRLGTLTDNGDVKGQVVGNVYVISGVTTNHTVIASFIAGGTTMFWRNISTGENTRWYMDGSTHTGTAPLDPLTGPWRMVATADFNNDGEADILWRNFSTGANMVWYMNGTTHTGSADLEPVPDQNWRIVGTADFNSDGKPDIVWRNIATGANMVWYMNGITHTGSADLMPVADQNWKIVGAADFNSDGKADLLWRNSATGQNVLWYMEGINRSDFATLDAVTDQNWKIVGTIDLNNDGKPDILWRNTATGEDMIWYMNGATHTGTANLDAVTDQNMEMAGQGNYSTVPTPTLGQCGSANNQTFTTAPSSNLCASGTPSVVTGTGPWTWMCQGSNGGSTANCQANVAVLTTWTVTPSATGSGAISPDTQQIVNNATTKSFTITPDPGYGASVSGTCGGSPSSGIASFTYITNPVTTDCTVVVTFSLVLDIGPLCGSANGGGGCSAPTTNLCSAGIPSAVIGSGPWMWTCQGANGTVQCQANPSIWTITSSVTGGSGTTSCTSPVCQGSSSTCTITPNNGYRLATLTDNGSDVKGQVAGNAYTISTVTANHTVVGTFTLATPGASIFWRNIATGENTLWDMNGATHTGTATLDPLTGPWRMVATADFNNDGGADILWRNFATGANMVWYMNGATHTGSADLDPFIDLNWRIIASADFNSDGKPDILWRNIATGANMVWYMNGTTHTGSADITSVPDQNWKIVGAADFNSDHKADLLWRNGATGQDVVWYMDGTSRSDFAIVDTVTDQNWKIVGTFDLNNDGKPDILWRNTSTGANTVWYMNGATHTGTASLDTVTDQNIEMAGQGNYSAPPSPFDGVCGSSNNQTFTTTPATNLCTAGSAGAVTGSGPWSWTCGGSNGGSTATCRANVARTWTVTPSPVGNGALSPDIQQTINENTTISFTIIPDAGYGASVSGTCGGSPATGIAPFTYTTNLITTDCTVVATFISLPPSGACGSANGGIFTSAPASNLCSAGIPSAVTGSGPWIWACQGVNSTAQCQANSKTWSVTASVTGGNGTISCTSTVNHGLSSPCKIVPNKGYRIATLTDNGNDVMAQVTGNVYTISNVTTDHTVVVSFIARGATILWRNTSTGADTVWYMDGATHAGTATLDPLTGPWKMVATADFNNDGEADILWRNFSTGANMVWYMNGIERLSAVDLPPVTDQSWRIIAAADFNADGKPDILWRNISTGENIVWYMDGITHMGSDDLVLVPDEDWKIVGVADFNSDGKTDIIWRNSVTGVNVVWFLDGVIYTGFAILDDVTNQNWKLVRTIDLNNDGKPDILWRNTATGEDMVWYMNGATHAGTASLDVVTDQNMEMAGQNNN
jgi:hypothetical protein